jgi:F0F1-type ATP synthase membrane subunit b/b'
MFNRPRSPSEGEPPAGPSGPAESSGSDAARAFDQVLSEIQPPGTPPTDPHRGEAAATATEHAETLRATRGAHHEAQQMLAMATEARTAASEEAERIVLEARDAADRTRKELAGWAAAQRAKVDALAADMVESANRDADAIRAEALRTSMAEAEETARAHIAEAAQRAQREADEIRDDARQVLHRAVELGDEVTAAFEDLTTTVGDTMTRLHESRVLMEQLLDENRAPDPEAGDVDSPAGADTTDDADGDDVELDDEDESAGDEPDEASEDGAVDDGEDEYDEVLPDVDEQTDRQLGSLFRRHGQRSE